MFERLLSQPAQSKPIHAPDDPSKLSVQSAKELLSTPTLLILLNKLRATLTLPEEFPRYADLCEKTIRHFAEFVQHLPETEKGLFSKHRGLLELALERACRATILCRNYLLPEETPGTRVSQEHALWMFVVFSASLFHRIGKSILKTHVELFNADVKRMGAWEAMSGTMNDAKATYYQFSFKPENFEHLGNQITKLLGRQILPEKGFLWIAKDPGVLAVWLALLDEEWSQLGAWANILSKAHSDTLAAQLKKQTQTKTKSQNVNSLYKLHSQADAARRFGDPIRNPSHLATVQAFLNWVQEGIEKKSIAVNKTKSSVFVTKDGVVVLPQIFKEFAEKTGLKGTGWQVLIKNFSQLGITTPDSNNNHVRIFRAGIEGKDRIKGLLVNNPYMIFPEGIPPLAKVPLSAVVGTENLAKVIPGSTPENTNNGPQNSSSR